MGRTGQQGLQDGQLRFGAVLAGSRVTVRHPESCPDIGAICQVRDEPPQLHDQDITALELRLAGEIGLGGGAGLEVQLPVRLADTAIVYRRLDGTPFVPDYEPIHHRNETLTGVGDPLLLYRHQWQLDALLLVLRTGVQVPLGKTERDPFALGRAGLRHQHLQFGTGTLDPVLELGAQQQFGRWQGRLGGQARLSLYENARGYQAGNRVALFGQLWRSLAPAWAVGGAVDVVSEFAERWDGRVQQDGNVGRTDVLVGAGAAWIVSPHVLQLLIKRPVLQAFHQQTEHGQLRYPFVIELAWSWLGPPP